MAKLTRKRLDEVRKRILHGGDFLERVAFDWKLPVEKLKEQLEGTYEGGKKNSQYKAIIQTSERNSSRIPKEELEKLRILPKSTRRAKTSTPTPAPVQTAQTPAAGPMEGLLQKKEALQRKLAKKDLSLRKTREILRDKENDLTKAIAEFEKAQEAVLETRIALIEAQESMRQEDLQHETIRQELKAVEEEIQRNQVYLVAPWYSGVFPQYGTFFSTVEMEGVQVLESTEVIKPKFDDMLSAGFDLGSEYMNALAFVALVQEYILKGQSHSVLNTDPRVQKLLDKHIG